MLDPRFAPAYNEADNNAEKNAHKWYVLVQRDLENQLRWVSG
jgi:hypothetical protein